MKANVRVRVCVRVRVRQYPGVRLQQQLCFWLSVLIFIVSDSTTISYEPLSQAASALSSRIYGQGPDSEIKTSKTGRVGVGRVCV